MVIDVYNGKWGIPGKCGSRYFAKTELITNWEIPTKYRVSIDDLKHLRLEAIVIRNPMSHLKSALQTEVMECFNDVDKIYHILQTFTNMQYGGTHFHPQFCNMIYKIWYQNDLRIIDLSKLSEFMKEILQEIPYNSIDYDFHNETTYKTKEEVWNKCIELYPDLMNNLIEFINIDTKYYNALLNGDRKLFKII